MTDLPDELNALVPLLAEWNISDDLERGERIERAGTAARKALIAAVIPRLPAINAYLDSFGSSPSEQACSFGTLAEAAIEAQMFDRG